MRQAYLTAAGTRVIDMTEIYRRASQVLNAAHKSSMERDQVDWAALGWRMTKAALWITIGFAAGLVVAAVQYGVVP